MPGNAGIGLISGTEQVWYISSGFVCFVASGLCLACRDWMLARILAVQKLVRVYHSSLLE